MDELFDMVCGVFRDFVEGHADSMTLERAVDAYERIVGATPLCVKLRFDIDDDASASDVDVDEESDEVSDSVEVADSVDSSDKDASAGFEEDDSVLMPDVMVDTSDDDRGVTVPVIIGEKQSEDASAVDDVADGDAESSEDSPADLAEGVVDELDDEAI